MRAEQEDVARHRLDRPVLVDRADERVVGLGDHPVVTGLGNGTAGREGRQARALASADLVVDRVVVEVRGTLAAAGLDAVGDQVDDIVELLAGELGVRRGAPHQLVELVRAPFPRRDLGHHLLRGDVERELGWLDGVESARAYGREQRRALDQLVACERVETTLGRARAAVIRPADTLQERRDAAR